MKTEREQYLIKKIQAANLAFSKGLPFMTDKEYDVLWEELYKINPDNNCLYHTTTDHTLPLDIFPHSYPVKGTQKAFNTHDLKIFLTRFGSEELIMEPKYDGCAAVFYQGKSEDYDRLILEGNGICGREISRILPNLFFNFSPRPVESVELVIPLNSWKDSMGANPRNAVAGMLAAAEMPEKYLIEVISHNHGLMKSNYKFNGDFNELEETLLALFAYWSETYKIDGIMIKVADHKKRLIAGDNGSSYNWSIAWKPPIQTKKTIVTDIEWNVSRTGRVVPTVIYEPIDLCSTMNSRVTGNNAQWIIDKRIAVENEIKVGKAGEIIPKIIKSYTPLSTLVHLPELCPICEQQLIKLDRDLFCFNDNCIAKITKQVAYFYSDKGMELKSIGTYMIADLLQNKILRPLLIKKPWALLDPNRYKIYHLIKAIWGDSRTATYMENREAISGKKNAVHFIAALGLPGLAYKTSIKIFHYIKTGKLKSHIPKKAQLEFPSAFLQFSQAKDEFTSFEFAEVPPPAVITYCITGTLSSSRTAMVEYLSKFRWNFSNQVSKFTDYLIIGESPGQTKQIKAQELNIMTITEEDLPKYLKEKEENG